MVFKNAARRIVEAIGVEVYKRSDWKWSHHVDGYYPVDAIPRWGYGKPPHSQIAGLLASQRPEFSSVIETISKYRELFNSIPAHGDPSSPLPFWQNKWFENMDALALVGFLASKKPKLYLEIGSGNSTKFARHTMNETCLSTRLVSIDPEPRASIDALCDEVIRNGLEYCDLQIFDRLQSGDILFFDGSHRTFTNSDVTVFFLEVIPRLKPGVIVHIHDIFLPVDYPPEWGRKLYSEQYLLAAMLLCPRPPFRVFFPNWYICNDPQLKQDVTALLSPLGCLTQGWSFWVEMT